jgi:hypothetical protein
LNEENLKIIQGIPCASQYILPRGTARINQGVSVFIKENDAELYSEDVPLGF